MPDPSLLFGVEFSVPAMWRVFHKCFLSDGKVIQNSSKTSHLIAVSQGCFPGPAKVPCPGNSFVRILGGVLPRKHQFRWETHRAKAWLKDPALWGGGGRPGRAGGAGQGGSAGPAGGAAAPRACAPATRGPPSSASRAGSGAGPGPGLPPRGPAPLGLRALRKCGPRPDAVAGGHAWRRVGLSVASGFRTAALCVSLADTSQRDNGRALPGTAAHCL